MKRSFVCAALAAAAILSSPAETHSQVGPGVHVAHATDAFGGVTGAGASLRLNTAVLPVDFFLAGEMFFPECEDCSFWGGSADVHVSLPVAALAPYATAGLVLRNTDAQDTRVRTGGLGFGAGLNLSAFVVGAYGEGRYEIMDGSSDQLVFRLGLRF